ncbi:uncharacterized protein LOC130701365 [Daphnia carinata]|uniref:uncharacterized protein LOC130701365 n=1 Tax=Daphnia carinata TaxID=120202 RepID=UPI0025803284|nr:uncharacterized protein LOC130701365 [Daphnia carinata]
MSYDCCVAQCSSQTRSIRVGFRTTAIIGLLIGIITVIWQIRSHTDMNQFDTDWSFELEICFGIYGFFLASTSYYLGEIHASSWAKFHIVVSAIGIVLDLVLFGHHATSVIKIDRHLVGGYSDIGNDHFMISIATIQAANNSAAIFLCRKLLRHEKGVSDAHALRESTPEPTDGEETSTLLKKQEPNHSVI